MAPPFLRHLRHTMTLWEWNGTNFSPGVLFDPTTTYGGVRWGVERQNKFSREAERSSIPLASILVQRELKVGDCVAKGDHLGRQPWQVPTVHEILEYRETDNLFDQWKVQRIMAKPLLGQMRQVVRIFPLVRQETPRGYTVDRGPIAYEGTGSVDMTPSVDKGGTPMAYADSQVLEYDSVVTVPYTALIDFNQHYEIEWESPYGLLVLDSQGPFFNNALSPFWRSLAAKARRPQTGEAGGS